MCLTEAAFGSVDFSLRAFVTSKKSKPRRLKPTLLKLLNLRLFPRTCTQRKLPLQ